MSKNGMPDASAQHKELLQAGMRAHRAGDLLLAERLYKQLNEAAPRDPNVLTLLGVLHAQRRQFADAARFLAQGVALSANPEALNNYGAVLIELGQFGEAIARLRQAVDARPGYAEAHYNLGNALRRAGRLEPAISSFRAAISLRPGYLAALQNISDALREGGQHREAIACLREAVARQPANAVLHNNLGIALRDVGELAEAREAFDRAIALDGRLVNAYYNRTRAGKIAPGDAIIGAIEQLKRSTAPRSPEERGMLAFALGKAYDDIGEYDKAFAELAEANGISRSLVAYDEAAELAEFDRLEARFNPAFLASRAGAGLASEVPIFIVGFPRSGTTLTEQILASHPAVHGAGELHILPDIIASGGGIAKDGTPESDMGRLHEFGALYLERLARIAPDSARITDKNPGNGPLLGYIHLTLPGARIVYVTRDPRDACLSCFMQRFAGNSSSFAYDLGEVGRRYRHYSKIMAHWRRTLPEGSILQICYEDLVANLEPTVRRLLDHCGLPWDERCLNFHEAGRSVRTASATQVRQSLYASSLARWRRYEKHLGPLIAALGPDLAPADP